MESGAATAAVPATAEVWRWLGQIPDPEVPAISIVDLGIVRDVGWDDSKPEPELVVTITPTYSGCPAMDMISQQIVSALRDQGIARVRLEARLSPPWTTDWMSAAGRQSLRQYGIAPPAAGAQAVITLHRAARASPSIAIGCPRCGSSDTECISEFGSTSCKALWRCKACAEPFDRFKCH
jgi:ring-1,2-phenylacetyl-CoA epoxidase subunit PaaD